MTDWHMEALEDHELAELADQALASLRARYDADESELAALIERACDSWDEFADTLPGFRP